MVLLFLRDWRSSLIVVATIPFALLAAVVALWGAGQTLNIMTLGGLALAVGILVDEATVAIENIHTHVRTRRADRAGGARRQRRSRGAAAAGDARRGRRVRAVVLHDRRVAIAVRAAVARRGLLDDRVVPAVELARAGARRLAAARGSPDARQAPRTGSIAGGDGLARRSNGSCPRAFCWSRLYVRGHRRHRGGRRPPARPRDLSGRRRASVPAPLPRARRHEVRVDRAAGGRGARRDQGPQARETWTSRWATSASSPRRIPSTRSSCGRAARTKACCRSRSEGRRHPPRSRSKSSFASGLRRAFRRRSSRSSPATSSAAF